MRRPRSEVGSRRHTLSIVAGSSFVQDEAGKEVSRVAQSQLNVGESDRVDFDEALLPEDSWEGELEEGEFEVKKIVDVRSGQKTRYGRVHREFLVHWKVHSDLSWVDKVDLNCSALLQRFDRDRVIRNRFGVMQKKIQGARPDRGGRSV